MEYTKIVPCTIKYTWNPAEKASATEPFVEEEFTVDEIKILGIGCTSAILSYHDTYFEDALYEYLKGLRDA